MKLDTQRIVLVAGLALGAIFAWLALADVRWDDLRGALGAARLWVALPFVLVLALFYWLKAARWRRLLAPTAAIPTRALLPSLLVGFAANNILPAHLGEVVRAYLLGRERGIAASAVLGTVVLERLFDVLAVLVLMTLALTVGNALGAELRAAGAFLAAVALLVLLPAIVLVFRSDAFVRLAGPVLRALPQRLGDQLRRHLTALAAGFGALRERHQLAAILLNSLLQWLLMASCAWLAMAAFGLDVPWVAAVVVLVLIVAGITLPAGPGYIGTIEYCFVLGLKAYGVTAGLALSVGLFYHALTWGFLAVTGLFFLRRYGLDWRALRRAVAQS